MRTSVGFHRHIDRHVNRHPDRIEHVHAGHAVDRLARFEMLLECIFQFGGRCRRRDHLGILRSDENLHHFVTTAQSDARVGLTHTGKGLRQQVVILQRHRTVLRNHRARPGDFGFLSGFPVSAAGGVVGIGDALNFGHRGEKNRQRVRAHVALAAKPNAIGGLDLRPRRRHCAAFAGAEMDREIIVLIDRGRVMRVGWLARKEVVRFLPQNTIHVNVQFRPRSAPLKWPLLDQMRHWLA